MLSIKPQEFRHVQKTVFDMCGININDGKKALVEARLTRRLRALNLASFSEYLRYLGATPGEAVHFIDAVTTNKTDFFREREHFEVLDQIFRNYHGSAPFRIWSAGCSSGEEPYTMAMVLDQADGSKDFQVVGSDISSKVLEQARGGIYHKDRIVEIERQLQHRYFMRSKDPEKELVRVVPELRKRVSFVRLNFMDQEYPFDKKFHVAFCRNVLIYFDRDVQRQVLMKICNQITPGGILIIGFSETITELQLPVEQLRPTVYRVCGKGTQ